MMLIYNEKTFSALNVNELYAILRLRSEVFVVEQLCVYQDIDDKDQNARHCWLEEDGRIVAYLRVYWRNEAERIVQIGRVVTADRGKGYGKQLLSLAVDLSYNYYKASGIYIEAQTYAIGFYEKAGFKVSSAEFLEDGIPHVEMMHTPV